MKIFIYNASKETEKDIKDRERLIERIKDILKEVDAIDEHIKVRSVIFSNMLDGILNSYNQKSTSESELKLISGGEPMKYSGISIKKHKTCDTWYARYRKSGKQFYVSGRSQQECYNNLKIALKQKVQQVKNQTVELEEPPSMTFLEWYNKWLKFYKQDVKEGTISDYKKSLAYLESIQNKCINKITSIEMLEILSNIKFERTKQKVYEFASAVFNKALANEIITKNPMVVIDKPKHKRVNGMSLTNSDEIEFEKILVEKQCDMFLVCLYQGLRKGEMLALTFSDIDFENKTLTINKSINRFNEVDTTKNTYSNRIMPLFDKTAKILEKYKDAKGRIFNIAYQSCENKFKKIIEKHFESKRYTIHSLRHTFITRCQECNIPLHIIQKWVGHVIGSNVTNQVYTHTREVAELENFNVLNEKLNSN